MVGLVCRAPPAAATYLASSLAFIRSQAHDTDIDIGAILAASLVLIAIGGVIVMLMGRIWRALRQATNPRQYASRGVMWPEIVRCLLSFRRPSLARRFPSSPSAGRQATSGTAPRPGRRGGGVWDRSTPTFANPGRHLLIEAPRAMPGGTDGPLALTNAGRAALRALLQDL